MEFHKVIDSKGYILAVDLTVSTPFYRPRDGEMDTWNLEK
jgi:hypothetical protein